MQPALSESFLESPQWSRLSASARGVLQGMLELAIPRDGEWFVDGTPKELSEWFGRELHVKPSAILAGLRELDMAGYLKKGRRGFGSRFILAAPLVER